MQMQYKELETKTTKGKYLDSSLMFMLKRLITLRHTPKKDRQDPRIERAAV